jgi:hypothetical protein
MANIYGSGTSRIGRVDSAESWIDKGGAAFLLFLLDGGV